MVASMVGKGSSGQGCTSCGRPTRTASPTQDSSALPVGGKESCMQSLKQKESTMQEHGLRRKVTDRSMSKCLLVNSK